MAGEQSQVDQQGYQPAESHVLAVLILSVGLCWFLEQWWGKQLQLRDWANATYRGRSRPEYRPLPSGTYLVAYMYVLKRCVWSYVHIKRKRPFHPSSMLYIYCWFFSWMKVKVYLLSFRGAEGGPQGFTQENTCSVTAALPSALYLT